jgi:hypothetical protein
MPAAHGSASTGAQTNGLSPLTISYTINAGTNLVLYVGAGVDSNADRNPTATYNGVAMTLVGETIGGASAQPTALFRTINPATGTHDVVISTDFANANDHIVGIVQCFNDVDQTTPEINTVTRTSGASTTSSLDVTSSVGSLVIDVINMNSQAAVSDFAADASQATIGESVSDGTSNGMGLGMSSEAGAATTTMSWSFVSASRVGHIATSLNAPAVATTPMNVSPLFIMGMG